ncbi:MAG: winged helix-turn-helix transcriptional regulator [candidate division WOR-3 bacterium]|nr:MAG: winged helix-turn-helix transcriptional regulator [candidate division WOR-3 bacterium]
MKRMLWHKPMKEVLYRESRVAKALGEPARYLITILLLKHGPLQVSEIAKRTRRSQPTVSHHLSVLKGLEIVRYETKPEGVYYWIKYPDAVRLILESFGRFIRRTQIGLEDEK